MLKLEHQTHSLLSPCECYQVFAFTLITISIAKLSLVSQILNEDYHSNCRYLGNLRL